MGSSSTDLRGSHPEPPAEPTRQELVLQASERSQAAHAVLVVGFDRRPESLAALVTAAELGRRVAAELRVIHAIDLTDYPVDPDSADWEDKGRELLQQEQETVARQLAHYEYSWSYVALHGDPVRALSWVADELDALMIVVGSRGEGWHRPLRADSVPLRVAPTHPALRATSTGGVPPSQPAHDKLTRSPGLTEQPPTPPRQHPEHSISAPRRATTVHPGQNTARRYRRPSGRLVTRQRDLATDGPHRDPAPEFTVQGEIPAKALHLRIDSRFSR